MTYSALEINQITTLRKEGVSWDTISQLLGKKPDALRQWWSRYSKIADLPPKPKITKTLTSGRVGLQLKKIIRNDPTITVRDSVQALGQFIKPGQAIPSKSTVHRFLQVNELVMIKFLKKPLVSDKNKQKRVEFASYHLQQLDKLMHETIWSDETAVRKAPNGHDVYFRCHSSTNKEDLPTNFQIQQGGFSVMFWGCFSAFGLGPLVALEGNQNQHTYLETFKNHLLPEIEVARSEFGIDMTFMQDNAPCHKTRLITNWLETHRIPTLSWPPQSPDMNPIENLWSIIKNRRQKKYGIQRTKVELVEQVFQIWEEIDMDLLYNLTDSIENRLKEVIRLRGRPTKY